MAAQVRAALARRTPVLATRLPRDADPSLLSIGGTARERALLRAAPARRRSDRARADRARARPARACSSSSLAARRPPPRAVGERPGRSPAPAARSPPAGSAARTLHARGLRHRLGRRRRAARSGAPTSATCARGGSGSRARGSSWRRPRHGPSSAERPAVSRRAAGRRRCSPRARSCSPTASSRSTSPRRLRRGVLLYLGARRLLAGRARLGLAGAGARRSLIAGAAVAASGPAPAPHATARGARAAPAAKRAARPPAAGTGIEAAPRICFASMQDARAAAEGGDPGRRGRQGARRRAGLRARPR